MNKEYKDMTSKEKSMFRKEIYSYYNNKALPYAQIAEFYGIKEQLVRKIMSEYKTKTKKDNKLSYDHDVGKFKRFMKKNGWNVGD